ncbi:MAG: DUF1566 domain-containing protein [Moraxella sp.]|nr:DUF1566 domain-containing protein [Moraxella sp.]
MTPSILTIRRATLSIGLATALTALPIVAQAQTCPHPGTRPDSRYTLLNNDSEVKDNVTGLIWQRCSLGQTWNGTTCTGTASTYNWQQALTAANALGNGYRLPNLKELTSLVDDACYNPAINERMFPNTVSGYYWSSSPVASDTSYAWGVSFNDGYTDNNYKSGHNHVRAVRPSQ